MIDQDYSYRVLEFSGRDSFSFLQAQLATDLRDLRRGAARSACLLNAQGRVLAMGTLLRRSDEVWHWLLEAQIVPEVAAHLRRFILRSKLSIQARPELSVTVSHEPGPGTDEHWLDASGRSIQITSLGPSEQAHHTLSLAARVRAMRHGLLDFGLDHQDRYLPDALRLASAGAVSLQKGCYPGQEVVARLHYLGRGKRHMRLLAARHQPLDHADIMDGSGTAIGKWLNLLTIHAPTKAARLTLEGDRYWQGLAVIEDRASGQLLCAGTAVTTVTLEEIELLELTKS